MKNMTLIIMDIIKIKAERDELEIYLDDDKVVLKKYEPSCIFCNSACGLVTYRGRNVCMECIEKMSNI